MRFKVSTNIKNVLGKDLISDKYIAIFELVKNSCDAGASLVSINFIAEHDKVSKIIISDDGCGMTSDDLQNKWLFMAYSEKRHGDQKNRMAGSKGIGRFSCDRLGEILKLYTKKANSTFTEELIIDWRLFEQNDMQKVEEIDLPHREISQSNMFKVSGTILEISDLREEWKREDILKLRAALMKLVSPQKSEQEHQTKIEIIAEHERDKDNSEQQKDKRGVTRTGYGNLVVNGPIINDVFEKLGLKTTSISVFIPESGDTIETVIEDRGTFVFRVLRKNETYNWLENISIKLFYLNRAAKVNFARTMGIDSVNYGSIFVYKNGFRVYPYGNKGIDFFKINERKSQGYNRYLGTRELMGRIEINGDNEHFVEKSSRDGGFIDNPATAQLEEFFIAEAIRVLEKYVVDGIDWGDPERTEFQLGVNEQGLSPIDVADKILLQFASLTNRGCVLKAEINPDIVKKVQTKEDALQKSIRSLERISTTSSSQDIKTLVDEIKKETDKLRVQKEESEKAVDSLSENLRRKEAEVKTREKQAASLKQKLSKDSIQYEDALHMIYVLSEANLKELEAVYRYTDVSNDKAIEKLSNVINNNRRIYKLADLSLNYNFNMGIKKPKDIVSTIRQYANEFWGDRINIVVSTSDVDWKIVCNFDISKLSIIIDNIISNSLKAKAKKMLIKIRKSRDEVCIDFIDDGVGLASSIGNSADILERGYSTTFGFGLGLYHVKKIVDGMQGKIRIYENVKNGFAIGVSIKYECKF